MHRQAHLGPYTLEHPVGRGGFATVWSARHRTLGTLHALKVLDAVSAGRRERLEQEGRLQARLDPRHVVPVTDVVQDGPDVALVMPLVQGCTLAELLGRHAPDEAEALALFRGLLDGVEVAHNAGVVHRDLKPANVLLDIHRGRIRVRVTDFGIATTLDAPADEGFSGTPAYASPEQHAREPLDPRSDLWSLGAILVELLTGARAADGVRPPVTSTAHTLCADLLQDKPEDRPADVAAVRRALADELHDASVLFVGRPLATVLRSVERSRRPDDPRAPTLATTLITWTDGADELPPHNLPVPPTTLFARDDERARVAQFLSSERAITWLVGPAGVGKSALAMDIAWTLLVQSPGGTTWVPIPPDARTEASLIAALARSLDVQAHGADRKVLQVALAARGRCLVVLDGADDAVQVIETLLDALSVPAPSARFLITSRVVPADTTATVPLHPLTVDDAAHLLQHLHPRDLDLDEARRQVQRIDRLPLALELLAGLRELPPEGAPIGLDLAATLRGSWDPLPPWQQQALAGLAAFEGPFDLDAATAVLSLPAHAPPPLEVLDQLVRRSLVRPLGQGWFSLLGSVRALAASHASDPDADSLAVAAYLSGFGTPEALLDLEGHGGPARLRALSQHLGDLLRACRIQPARLSPDVATALALACWAVLDNQGPLHEGPRVLGWARDRPDLTTEQGVRLDLGLIQALALLQRLPEAAAVQQRALDALPDIADRALRAQVHLTVAGFALRRTEPAALQAAIEQAQRASDDPRTRYETLKILGAGAARSGRHVEAVEVLQQTIQLAMERGDRAGEGHARMHLANVLSELDRVEEALPEYLRCLDALGETSKRRTRAIAQANLGLLHRQCGDLDQAARTLDAALQEHRAIGNLRSAALALVYRGNTLELLGRLEEARASFAAGEEALLDLGSTVLAADARGHRGRLLAADGQLQAARHLLESALQHHDHGVYPTAASTWLRELAIIASRQGQPWHALIERALQVGNSTPMSRVETLTARAQLRLQEGDLAGARADIDAALAEDPRALVRADLRRVDALLAHAEGRPRAARDALAEALDLAQTAGLGHEAVLMQMLRRTREVVG